MRDTKAVGQKYLRDRKDSILTVFLDQPKYKQEGLCFTK